MKIFIKTAMIFSLLILAIPAFADDLPSKRDRQTNVSDFSDPAIVGEYKRRLTHILEEQLPAITVKYSEWQEKRNNAQMNEEPLSPEEEKLAEDVYAEYRNIAGRLVAFASTGDQRAQEIIGPILMLGTLGNAWICDGLEYTFAAAKNGSPAAANSLAVMYMLTRGPLGKSLPTDAQALGEQFWEKANLWLMEAMRNSGEKKASIQELLANYTDEERRERELAWLRWSPALESIDDLKEQLCPEQANPKPSKDLAVVNLFNGESDFSVAFNKDRGFSKDIVETFVSTIRDPEVLAPLAEDGDARAQSDLSLILSSSTLFHGTSGKLTPNPYRDLCLADHWINESARQGYPEALTHMAIGFLVGGKWGKDRKLASFYLWRWAESRGFEKKNYETKGISALTDEQLQTWLEEFQTWNVETAVSFEPKSCPDCTENCLTVVKD